MTITNIVQLQSLEDNESRRRLETTTSLVTDFGTDTQEIITNLLDTLAHYRIAVGLAAPQIGSNVRIAVIDLKVGDKGQPIVLVNPRVVDTSGRKETKKESCMSVPHYRGPVERRSKVRVLYEDRHGTPCELSADGFLARVVLHEVDHLDGLLYLDRMADLTKLEPVEFFRDSIQP